MSLINFVLFVCCQKNNAMGRLNLNLQAGEDYTIEFINLGAKDWRANTIDAVDDQRKGVEVIMEGGQRQEEETCI